MYDFIVFISIPVQLIEKRSWEHDSTYLYVTEKVFITIVYFLYIISVYTF